GGRPSPPPCKAQPHKAATVRALKWKCGEQWRPVGWGMWGRVYPGRRGPERNLEHDRDSAGRRKAGPTKGGRPSPPPCKAQPHKAATVRALKWKCGEQWRPVGWGMWGRVYPGRRGPERNLEHDRDSAGRRKAGPKKGGRPTPPPCESGPAQPGPRRFEIWRKAVGVEPTRERLPSPTEFEVQPRHRTRLPSMRG